MSAPGAHTQLPDTSDVSHPPRALLHGARPAFRRFVHHRWPIELVNADVVPRHGPVIFAANHVGWLDGPLMAIVGPRPVHALTKRESFHGATGRFLSAAGQIPVDRYRPDPAAIKKSLRVLSDGGCVGVFPEGGRGAGLVRYVHGGAAYLAMASGAPIVPMAMLGTRLPGAHSESIPPKGTPMALVYGEPLLVDARPWPRTKAEVRAVSRDLGDALRETVARAQDITGLSLPGPLPTEEHHP